MPLRGRRSKEERLLTSSSLIDRQQEVAIELKHLEGLAVCRRQVTPADLLVENFRPGAVATRDLIMRLAARFSK